MERGDENKYQVFAEQLAELIDKNDFENRHQKTDALMQAVSEAGLEWAVVVIMSKKIINNKKGE